MEYQDKTLTCRDCGSAFTFTAAEQEFYASKGFQNEPSRCPECRAKNKAARASQRQMYDAVCADCGAPTKVPFEPKEGRPVYCFEHYKAHQGE